MARPNQATIYFSELNWPYWRMLKDRYPHAADSKILNALIRDSLQEAVRYGIDGNCDIMRPTNSVR